MEVANVGVVTIIREILTITIDVVSMRVIIIVIIAIAIIIIIFYYYRLIRQSSSAGLC